MIFSRREGGNGGGLEVFIHLLGEFKYAKIFAKFSKTHFVFKKN